MQNLVPAISPSLANTLAADKTVTGSINDLPAEIKNNIKLGDNMLLQIIKNGDTLVNVGSRISVGNEISAVIKQFVNNQIKDIPVQMKLDKALALPLDENMDVVVRVTSQPTQRGESPQVRLVSINSLPPEKFIANAKDVVVENKANPSFVRLSAEPVQIVNNLKVLPSLEKVLQPFGDQGFGIKDVLLKEFQNAEFKVSFNSILPKEVNQPVQTPPTSQPAQTNATPLTQTPTAQTPVLDNPFDKIFKNIFQNVFNSMPSDVLPKIREELSALKTIIGEVVINDKNVTIIKTPLGEVYPDKNVKFEAGEKILLNIDKFIETKTVSNSITDMLKPLHDAGKNELASLVLSKFPKSGENLLPNLVSFIKSAGNHNMIEWLGKEVVEALNNSGAEGKEVMAKLNSFFAGNIKENLTWRIIEVPIFHAGALSQIKVAIKKTDPDEDGEDKEKTRKKYGTRFVVDTNFSILGRFQFDGFSHGSEKRFDLIVRTERDVGQDLISNIIRIFKNTLHQVDYIGNVVVNIKESFIKVDDNENKKGLNKGIYI